LHESRLRLGRVDTDGIDPYRDRVDARSRSRHRAGHRMSHERFGIRRCW